MKKVGIILPTEFRRLGPHYGGLFRWFEEEQRGILPRPDFIVGCSAGAIMGASCVPWNKENFEKIGKIILGLKAKQIFTMPRETEALFLTLAATALSPFVLNNFESKKNATLARVLKVSAALGAEAVFLHEFLRMKSVFSNEPLHKLLLSNLDFRAIFHSRIKLEIMTTDIASGEEVVFSNHSPQDLEPERFVKAILASSRLSGRFPPTEIDGRTLVDAGVLNSVPIHRAIKAGCDAIFIFLYTPPRETRRTPRNWTEDLIRSCQITESEVARLTLENYELRKRLNPDAKMPAIFVIRARETLEEMNFRNFSYECLAESMNLGYRAVGDNLAAIREFLAE